jgi:hypothetical protein
VRKGLSVLVPVLFFAAVLPSRAAAETGRTFGLKAGLGLSNVTWSFPSIGPGETSSERLTVGLLAEFGLGPWIATQPELDFVTTGYSWSDALGIGTHKYMLQYLQIPVLFKVRLVRKGRVVPAIFAGPSLGILLRARARYYDVSGGGPGYRMNVRGAYRDFDLGATFGAGLSIRVGTLRLILDARHYLGLTDVYRSADISVKYAGWMITGGFAL